MTTSIQALSIWRMLPRLQQIRDHTMDSDYDQKTLPTFDELPFFHEMPGCAWSVWGQGDQLGTVNLLTDTVVKRAAHEEIRCACT